MRIALVVHTFPSVTETFISNKAKLLAERKNEIIVFCVKINNELFRKLFTGNTNVKIIVISIQKLILYLISHPLVCLKSLVKEKDFRQDLFRKFRLDLMEKYSPDIIHFEFSAIGIDYLYEIEKLHGKKVVSCRGTAEKVKLLIYNERKEKFKELLKMVDAIHCVSKDMVNTITPYCEQPKKIFINFPSIDPFFFQRKKSKMSSPSKIILSVGRMTFQKGYANALMAIKSLKEKRVSFKWIIVGDGNKHEEIIFKIHQLNLQNEVTLTGSKNREEVKALMEEADIFFLPSLYEGIANVVLEAMAMELPVVATRSGGMSEVIDHEKDGLLTEVYDYESMSNHLATLCCNDSLRNCLGINARSKVINRFNIDRQIMKFETVYLQLHFKGSTFRN